MRNNHWLVLAACAIAAQGALAGESTAQQLTRIEAETAVLKARARKVEVQAQIANKNAEIAARNAESRRINEQPSASPNTPMLRAVDGLGGVLYATLDMPNGGSVDVRAGDRLSDGSRVLSVQPREVVLETSGKRRIKLGRSSTPSPSLAVPPAGAAAPMLGSAPFGAEGIVR